jgi:hypothetical protein
VEQRSWLERESSERKRRATSLRHWATSREGIRVTGRLEAAHAAGGHRRRMVIVRGVARARGRATGWNFPDFFIEIY